MTRAGWRDAGRDGPHPKNCPGRGPLAAVPPGGHGTLPYFPGAGCSGLNKPDSGVGAGGLLYIRLHRLERDAEADGCGPLAATSIGRGRK